MMRLLQTEWNRLRWRRATWVLVLLAVVIPVVMFAALAWNTRPATEAEIRDAKEMMKADDEFYQRDLADCAKNPTDWGIPADVEGADVEAACDQMLTPPEAQWYLDRTELSLDGEKGGTGTAVPVITAALLLILGASFIGHDWATGSMSNQLLFEPRRGRVWTAKAAVLGVTGFVVATVVSLLYWAALIILGNARDLVRPNGFVTDIVEMSLRAGLLAAAAAVAGFALAMLFRSTVGAIALLFVVSVAVPILLAMIRPPGEIRLQPANNTAAWLENGRQFEQWDKPGCDSKLSIGEEAGCMVDLKGYQAGVYFGVLTVLAAGASAVSFRRRDVS